MTTIAVSIVDLYPIRFLTGRLEVLALKRGPDGRCAGSWEVVHGHIEPGEKPVDAALRELREEAGLTPATLYNLSRVESFYLHRSDELAMIPVFVAMIDPAAIFALGSEHETGEWLSFDAAAQRLAWPRERRALEDIGRLFASGDAGLVEDVLRIC